MILKRRTTIFFVSGLFFFLPIFVGAQTPGSEVVFSIEPSYDYSGRQAVTAFLQQIGQNAYFYIDNDYYRTQSPGQKTEISDAINNLSREFDSVIYPKLREFYGSEKKPGIDGDDKITVLLFNMKGEAAGYFNPADEYPKIQLPKSNEREMIYLNVAQATSSWAKGFLAHEFVHLITFNQKDVILGISEETWLNETRAEYAPALLGYNDSYEGSILQKRVSDFLQNPSNSLTNWQNKKSGYGVINLFSQYLVDHYGEKIMSGSMKSPKIGIASINDALEKNGFQDDFKLIFTRWTIALLVNDCSFGEKYCYINLDLKSLRVTPAVNFLPVTGESSLQVFNATFDWSGNWFKIIGGGKGTLTFDFDGDDSVSFGVPYLLCDTSGKCQIQILSLDNLQKGEILIPDFSSKYTSLIFVPSIQSKMSGFEGTEPTYTFFWKVSISSNQQEGGGGAEENSGQIASLLAQIDQLKKQIAALQAQISSLVAGQSTTCLSFQADLYFGMTDNADVRCLQQFLKNQGNAIYPQGLITGNFFSLTQAAVKRYQAQKGIIQTGYFGPLTRAAANAQ
ncbi:MAG: hypothetical protein A2167_06495 [Planctomycetes bacterium RBG_13_46_10]|nr:MAG: hypothetical protein A2167_06495 [Planctomycetes bacterium RBG_13_46_10]